MADEFADHKYFEADYTAYVESPNVRDRFGIIVSEKPTRNADGTKSMFLRWPALIITEYTADAEEFAKTVAEVLQENAHRFFASARDDRGEAA